MDVDTEISIKHGAEHLARLAAVAEARHQAAERHERVVRDNLKNIATMANWAAAALVAMTGLAFYAYFR